jgi:hypothetical protein
MDAMTFNSEICRKIMKYNGLKKFKELYLHEGDIVNHLKEIKCVMSIYSHESILFYPAMAGTPLLRSGLSIIARYPDLIRAQASFNRF